MDQQEVRGKLLQEARTGTPTHDFERELVWFPVSRGLKGNWMIQKETERPFHGHTPFKLTVPAYEDLDLGSRATILTKVVTADKDHKTYQDTPSKATEGTVDWEEWSKHAENWLMEATKQRHRATR